MSTAAESSRRMDAEFTIARNLAIRNCTFPRSNPASGRFLKGKAGDDARLESIPAGFALIRPGPGVAGGGLAADDQAGGRDDSVVRTENGGSEPASATRSMTFTISQDRFHARCFREPATDFPRRRFAAAAGLHVQFRMSGMSSPYLAMYCLCSMSFSRIACCA